MRSAVEKAFVVVEVFCVRLGDRFVSELRRDVYGEMKLKEID